MGWLRSVLKIIRLFCKRNYKRDYILQKRPIILRSLLIVATPYWESEVFSGNQSFPDIFISGGTRFCWLSVLVDMGWLRLVGSLQLSVSFAKEPYERDYTLHKRPIVWRSLLIEATWLFVLLCLRVLQCVAVSCSVLQCLAVSWPPVLVCLRVSACVCVCCSVLQCVAVCCSVLQCVAVSCLPVLVCLRGDHFLLEICSRSCML